MNKIGTVIPSAFPVPFLETQLPHIVTMFSAHKSLAIDQLKGHLVRFARKYMMD